jgi:formylglycine-generating enzyme required for sulfatase activity
MIRFHITVPIMEDPMTRALLLLSPLAMGMLAACQASSLELPDSTVLTGAKVAEIAAKVDSQYPALPVETRQEIVNTVVRSLDEMVYVEGGTFEMGDFGWACEYDPAEVCEWPCTKLGQGICNTTTGNDNPSHEVKLSSYFLASKKTMVADFDLYRTSLGLERYRMDLRNRADLADLFEPNKPAWNRTWQEAKDYCLWLGALSAYPVDLPTEAQWEYAARSRGSKVLYPTDDGSLKLGENFPDESVMKFVALPVDAFKPNPLGLYRMAGGGSEWVNDWYAEDYYPNSPLQDPTGPDHGELKVKRGYNVPDTPWVVANTTKRQFAPIDSGRYRFTTSFRCSVQTVEL